MTCLAPLLPPSVQLCNPALLCPACHPPFSPATPPWVVQPSPNWCTSATRSGVRLEKWQTVATCRNGCSTAQKCVPQFSASIIIHILQGQRVYTFPPWMETLDEDKDRDERRMFPSSACQHMVDSGNVSTLSPAWRLLPPRLKRFSPHAINA